MKIIKKKMTARCIRSSTWRILIVASVKNGGQ